MSKAALFLTPCLVALFTASGLAQSTQPCPPDRTISVSARGTAYAQADQAVVHIGFLIFGPDAASAYSQASTTSNAIVKAATAAGVSQDAIESTTQSIEQTQTYELQKYPAGSADRRNHAWQVSEGWVVTVQPADAARVLNAAANAGANESGQIEWKLRDENALEARAAALAAVHARALADQIAAKMNVHILRLDRLQENQPGPIVMPQMRMMAVRAKSENPTAPLAIHSRRVETSVTVNAVFAIQ